MMSGRRLFGPWTKTKSEALPLMWQKIMAILEEAQRDQAPEFEITLSTFAVGYIPRSPGSPNTRNHRQRTFDTLIKNAPIGEQEITTITVADVIQWRDTVPGKSQTKNRKVADLLHLIRAATGPDLRIKPLKKEKEKEPVCLSSRQKDTLLALCEGPEPWKARAKDLIILALDTGVRRAELLELRHEDFDDEAIVISRSAYDVEGGGTKDPKSLRGNRWIPLTKRALAIVKRKESGYVLECEDGVRMQGKNAYRLYKTIVRNTSLSHTTIDDLRHTFCMDLLEAGADVVTVSQLSGHDPSVLLQRYARSRKDLKREAIAKRGL